MIFNIPKPIFSRGFNTDMYMNVAEAAITAPPLSMACWYYQTYDPSIPQEILGMISCYGSGNGHRIQLCRDGSNRVSLRKSSASSVGALSAGITNFRWAHAAGISASTSSAYAFLNGVAGAHQTSSVTPDSIDSTTLGRGGVAVQVFPGLIAWPAIWNVVLDHSEIRELANGAYPLTIRPENLIAFWDFKGGETEFSYNGKFALANTASIPLSFAPPIHLAGRKHTTRFLMGFSTVLPPQTYNETATGGVVCNGHAAMMFSDTASGGVVCAGTAKFTYNETTTGGVVCAGTATFTYEETATGGVVCAGTATFTYDETATGGVVCAGTALFTYNETFTGGVVCAGETSIDCTYNETSTGGVVCGGHATFVFDETTTGGVVCDGEATVNCIYNETSTGGVVCGGIVSAVYDESTLGGIVCSGTAVFTDNETATGGVVCNGETTPTVIYNITSTGGVVCAGEANIAATYNVTWTGGVVCGGISNNTYYEPDVEIFGGVICNGSATGIVVNNIIANGGMVCGGTATHQMEMQNTATGGVVCNGTVTHQMEMQNTATGGVVCAGVAFNQVSIIETTSGGIVVGGEASNNLRLNIVATGGVVISGTALVPATYNITGTGGVVLSGHFGFPVFETATGGVVCGGTQGTIAIIEGLGGVQIGGSAEEETFRTIAIVECKPGQYKCAIPNEDQECLNLTKVQGFGSKVLKNDRDPTAICLRSDQCNASSAYIASIILCRQNAFPEEIVDDDVEIIDRKIKDEEIVMLALVDSPIISSHKPKLENFKLVKNTPKMNAFLLESPIKEKKEIEPVKLQAIRINKSASSNSKPNEPFKFRRVVNTPKMNSFKKEQAPRKKVSHKIEITSKVATIKKPVKRLTRHMVQAF